MAGVTPGLRAALGRLQAFKVLIWGESSDAMPESASVRVDDLNEAHVVSSLLREQPPEPVGKVTKDFFTDLFPEGHQPRHQVVLDIDHPVHVVDSSTPGHHHLVIEVPGGIPDDVYWILVEAMVNAGIVEHGYLAASLTRGRTDVRLPWVSKADTPPTPPGIRCVRCGRPPNAISEYHDGLAADLGEDPETFAPTFEEIDEWCRKNEGTYSERTQKFACTACYIALGQPVHPLPWS